MGYRRKSKPVHGCWTVRNGILRIQSTCAEQNVQGRQLDSHRLDIERCDKETQSPTPRWRRTALRPPLGPTAGSAFLLGTPGSSPDFWRQVQHGKYSANLDTTGLAPSSLPYNLCVSDRIEPDPLDPSVAFQQPLYQHNCLTFFLK